MILSDQLDLSLLSRIEDAGLNASAPPQQRWMDGWLVRFSPGKAKRARCINAVAQGCLSVPAKLALAKAALDEVGLPLFVRVTPFSQPQDLDAILEHEGMQVLDNTRVMVLPDISRMPNPSALPAEMRLERCNGAAFAALIGGWRGSPRDQQLAHAQRLDSSPVPYQGYCLRPSDGGPAVACAQYVREDVLVGLYDVFTAPHERERGWARQLCGMLLNMVQHQGARTAYLQVELGNTAARHVYSRLGFVDGYCYHYRTDNPSAT